MIVKKILENLVYILVAIALFFWFSARNQISNFSLDSSISVFEPNIQGYDSSTIGEIKKLEYSVENCSDISPVRISYPKYWEGFDSLVNGEEINPLEIGEYPSVEQYLFSTSRNYPSELQSTKIKVNGTYNPRFLPSVKNCFLIENTEKFFTCAPWLSFSSNPINRKNLVITPCLVNICGEEEEISCLFEDYMPDYYDNSLYKDSYCIAADSKFCERSYFLKSVYSLY